MTPDTRAAARRTAATLLWAAALSAAPPAAAECPSTARGPEALAAALTRQDAAAVAAFVDARAVTARILEHVPDDAPLAERMHRELDGRIAGSIASVVTGLQQRGARLTVQRSAAAGVVMRKENAGPGVGLDYIEFDLGSDGCIVDWGSLHAGLRTSQMMRAASLALYGPDAAALLGVTPDPAWSAPLQALSRALGSKEPARIVSAIDALPAPLRDSYELTMFRLTQLPRDAGSAGRIEALRDVALRYGDTEQAQLALIERHLHTGTAVRALAAIDRVQQRVGVDAQTEALRGSALRTARRPDEAIAAVRNAARLAPQDTKLRILLIDALVDRGRHAEAVAEMDTVERELGAVIDHAALSADPANAALVGSAEYKAWRQRHASVAAPAESTRFTARDGIVRDSKTGLAWTQSDNGYHARGSHAQVYCAGLDTAGGGWRVPKMEELRGLYDTTTTTPCGRAVCRTSPLFQLSGDVFLAGESTAGSTFAVTLIDGSPETGATAVSFGRVLCVRR